MNPVYFETRFRLDVQPPGWPDAFVIITAYATTGQSWAAPVNAAADRRLAEQLDRRSLWRWRVTGYSPATGHAEPGWAVEMAWEDGCELGREFHQDAIYAVESDKLFVTHCESGRRLIPIGPFRERLDISP
jgi:hypothetical protein